MLTTVACTKTLPPAAAPERVAPQFDATAELAEGEGRLVVDVVDGSSAVERVHMMSQQVNDADGAVRFVFVENPEVLCASSPCVTDLPAGNILLGFPVIGDPGVREVELVHVGANETSVYRRNLSYYSGRTGNTRTLGIVGTALGGMAATAGAAMLPVGLAKDSDGLTIAGGASLLGGSALLALGIWAIRADAATYRPGSSIHFSFP
jgi:hypothetical protein